MNDLRPIPGFDGYFATDTGLIIGRRGRALTGYRNPKGYLVICIRSAQGQRPFPVHRLVAAAFHGPAPEGTEVRHLDGDQLNNAPSNLKWGTHLENIADKSAHGTLAVGSSNGNSKLTEDQVRTIRSLRLQNMSYPAIAKQFGVSHQLIQYVCKRVIWRHIA